MFAIEPIGRNLGASTFHIETKKDIKIHCSDSSILGATLYTPAKPVTGAIMIAPATGIKRKFYSSFASHLSQNGFGVITYDNNGIGDSLKEPIKTSKATLQSWGEIDMPAVLSTLQTNFPGVNYHLVGHSAGGQLVGLMPNAHQLTSMLNFAASSGRLKNMKLPFRLQARFLMDVFIPINNRLFGYTNTQWVGMGERLPKLVAAAVVDMV